MLKARLCNCWWRDFRYHEVVESKLNAWLALTKYSSGESVVTMQVSCKVAVKNGMSEEDALKSITINPAKICNIADKVGSIVPGKDADILVFSRDIFKSMCLKPDFVIAGGKILGTVK